MGSLFYPGNDPYATRLAFHVGMDRPIGWIFARDLLSTGSESRHGTRRCDVTDTRLAHPASNIQRIEVKEIA
jgi:hypothetical protein